MTLRIGELMVNEGLLTEDQVETILAEQRDCGGAFGDIAERMFHLDPRDVERVWAKQYATAAPKIDPRDEQADPCAIAAVSRRQAWQFRVLPMRFEGDDLVVCVTEENLARALRFVYRGLRTPCYFVISEAAALDEALMRHYPMPGGAEPTMEAMSFRVGRR